MNAHENRQIFSLELNEQTLPAIEQITDGMPGGFFIYHADGDEELIYVNQALINIFGCSSKEEFTEYIGGTFRSLVHPEDLQNVEESIYNQISMSSKGVDYVEYRIIRKDGATRWIRDYGRFVHTSLYEEDKEYVLKEFYDTIADYKGKKSYSVEYRMLTQDQGWRWFWTAGKLSRREDGSPVIYVGIFVDITRQKLTDEALNAQRKLLEDALQHIDNKQQAAKYLDKVMSAANDLQVLIDNLLDISHIESGKVDISETSCALPDILWELESIVRAEAKIRQLEMSVKCSGLAHENVFCDRQQLSQALMNLIGNALKFTPAGGKISVSLTESQGAPEGYGFYIFKVRDTGIGINKEFLELIFDPFERKHAAIPGG